MAGKASLASGVRYSALAMLCVAGWLGAPAPASAQDPGDVGAGRHLAETWCSSCHLMGGARQGASSGAPTFQAMANNPTITPVSLHAFLQTPHARMPDLHLTSDDIDDLAAYIRSLRRP